LRDETVFTMRKKEIWIEEALPPEERRFRGEDKRRNGEE